MFIRQIKLIVHSEETNFKSFSISDLGGDFVDKEENDIWDDFNDDYGMMDGLDDVSRNCCLSCL